MLGFHYYFDIQHNQDGRAVSSTYWTPFIPKEIPWYLLMLENEWATGPLNADRRQRSLENFQGPYRESNSQPPVLWHSTSTNCATAGLNDINAWHSISTHIIIYTRKHRLLVSKFNKKWKVTGTCCLSLSNIILLSNVFAKCTILNISMY